jgi:Fic family protein
LIKELVDWAKKAEVHPLIKSCVFHYEFEFIHPFSERNVTKRNAVISYVS